MKILLINLPTDSQVKDYTTPDYILADFMRFPPLGLMAVSAEINPKHTTRILDTTVHNMSIDEVVEYVGTHGPNVLGITVVTRRLYPMYAITKKVKQNYPDIKIVVGGPHVNYYPMETMQLGTIDYALPGYGEKTFPAFLEAIENNGNQKPLQDIPNLYYRTKDDEIRHNFQSKDPVILDSLPFPNRSLIDMKDYFTVINHDAAMTTVYSSRGCPFRCVFCDVQGKEFHFRSAKRMVDEFEELVGMGFKEIHILDDAFNIRRDRVVDICKEILKRNLKVEWSARMRVGPFDEEMADLMKRAGCIRAHVGVESLDPKTLRYIKKGQTLEQIKTFFKLSTAYNIETLAYFIIGFPNETREYRKHLLKDVKKLGVTYAYFNILFPLSRTEYYNSLRKDGVFDKDYWAEFIKKPYKDFELPLPRSKELQQELENMVDEYHRKFFLSPGFILRELRASILTPRIFLLVKVGILLILRMSMSKVRYWYNSISSKLKGCTGFFYESVR